MTTIVDQRAHATVAAGPAELALLMKHHGVDEDMAAEQLRQRRVLPEGWAACRTADGELYYHNSAIGASQWEHPQRLCNHHDVEAADVVASLVSEQPKAETDGPRNDSSADARLAQQHSVYDATTRHKELPAPQTLFSDAAASIQREDLQGQAFALHGLLTEAECAAYVEAAETSGFHDSDVGQEFPEHLRNNSRLIHFSSALATALWRRLAPQLAHRDIFLMQPMGFGAEGRWKPVGVNPCFRISRYRAAEQFAPHHDGMYVNDDGECSIYSLVLYLNDNFEGGELELPQNTLFRPRCGSAVFFPHDTLHAGRAVVSGCKYIARSELMFRCVDQAPAPREPSFLEDPLWQKMAALYEHIGDLATQGNPVMTTEAYQEALGIQIAHQGTKVIASSMSPLPLPMIAVAHAMSFLCAAEVLELLPISRGWQEASKMGGCWRSLFRHRWPGSSELIADTVFGLDAELKDWFGMYRRACFQDAGGGPACMVFIDANVKAQMQGCEPIPTVPARVHHRDSGIGWDRSLKQRSGWSVGSRYARSGWLNLENEVDWTVFPEILAWAFQELKANPSDHRVLLPALPGIMNKAFRARVARILARRFEVPRVHIPPAPLCALLAHGLSTGTVVWASSVGTCAVFCYQDAKEAGIFGQFSFKSGRADEIVDILVRAMDILDSTDGGAIFQHIVFSVQEEAAAAAPMFDGGRENAPEEEKEPWLCAAFTEIQSLLQERGGKMSGSILLRAIPGDVLKGASVLASSPQQLKAYDVAPDEAGCWEWRLQLVDSRWYQLPKYVAGVLEGALRDGESNANVRVFGTVFLVADLESFTVTLAHFQRRISRGKREPKDFKPIGACCKLTRFLRGRPSLTPDRRKPEELKRRLREHVEDRPVEGPQALHVRTLAGKLVLSLASRAAEELCVHDLQGILAGRLECAPVQLSLLNGAEKLEIDEALRPLFPEGRALELLVLVGPPPAPAPGSRLDEAVPEDVPGDCNSDDFRELVQEVRKYVYERDRR
mmetsp:Transcript_70468/g.177675  ORF Transcript_70468/g.177675 Transcript_70468/m.177675 type:complete len:1007 (-) Transcript_70468:99-3119(-)